MSESVFDEAVERRDWQTVAALLVMAAVRLVESTPRESLEEMLDLMEATPDEELLRAPGSERLLEMLAEVEAEVSAQGYVEVYRERGR